MLALLPFLTFGLVNGDTFEDVNTEAKDWFSRVVIAGLLFLVTWGTIAAVLTYLGFWRLLFDALGAGLRIVGDGVKALVALVGLA